MELPEIFHQLSSVPFLKCKKIEQSNFPFNHHRVYRFKIKGVPKGPYIFLHINDVRVVKQIGWNPGYYQRDVSFEYLIDNDLLSKEVLDKVWFYIDILNYG